MAGRARILLPARAFGWGFLIVCVSCDPSPQPRPRPVESSPSVTALPSCHRDQLVVLPQAGAVPGSSGTTWRFLNIGTGACSLRGTPGAEVLNHNDRILVASRPPTDGPDLVHVPPRGAAVVTFVWSNFCRGDAHVVRITLPGEGGELRVLPPRAPGCPDAKSEPAIGVGPFAPSTEVETNMRTLAVLHAPGRVVASDEGVWISGQDRLIRLDLEGRFIWSLGLGKADGALIGGGSDVAIGEGAVWVTCSCGSEPDPRFGATTGGVVKFDPDRNRVTAVRIFADRTPFQINASNGGVWVTTGDRVLRLTIDELKTIATIRLTTDFLVPGEGRIWAITGEVGEPYLAKIDPTSNRVVSRWRLPDRPSDMVEAFGSLWITNAGSGQLLQLDPETGSVRGRPISLFTSAHGIAAGSGSLWVTSETERSVKRIDPATGKTVATYDLDAEVSSIAAGPAAAWITSYQNETVTRLAI